MHSSKCPSVYNVSEVGGCAGGALGKSCGIVFKESSAWTLSIKECKDRLDIAVCFDLFLLPVDKD